MQCAYEARPTCPANDIVGRRESSPSSHPISAQISAIISADLNHRAVQSGVGTEPLLPTRGDRVLSAQQHVRRPLTVRLELHLGV